jgi:hypothetical protein
MKQSFVERVLSGEILLYSDIYSTIQCVPKQILTSDEKIILYELILLSNLDQFEKGESIELDHQDISKLTGLSYIKIKRTLSKLCDHKNSISQRLQKLNEYLDKMGRSESIALKFETYKGNNRRYIFEYSEPIRKKRLSIDTAASPGKDDGKLQLLKLTGFPENVLRQYLKYDIEKLDRNVKYFLDYQNLKGEKLGIGFLTSSLNGDWGLLRMVPVTEMEDMFNDAISKIQKIYDKNNFEIPAAPVKEKLPYKQFSNIFQVINELADFGRRASDKNKSKLNTFVDYCKHDLKFKFYSLHFIEDPFYIAACTQVITGLINFQN